MKKEFESWHGTTEFMFAAHEVHKHFRNLEIYEADTALIEFAKTVWKAAQKDNTLKTEYTIKQQELNEEHVKNPQIGDFWHEMFGPYFLVVGIVTSGVIVLDEIIFISKNHYKFDETKPKFISLESLKERVTYPTMRDKFVANVMVKKYE